MMKTVNKALIHIVTAKQLEPRDEILFSNIRCEVVSVNGNNVHFKYAHDNSLHDTRAFNYWYKLVDCKEKIIKE